MVTICRWLFFGVKTLFLLSTMFRTRNEMASIESLSAGKMRENFIFASFERHFHCGVAHALRGGRCSSPYLDVCGGSTHSFSSTIGDALVLRRRYRVQICISFGSGFVHFRVVSDAEGNGAVDQWKFSFNLQFIQCFWDSSDALEFERCSRTGWNTMLMAASLKIGCHQYSKATHQVDHWNICILFCPLETIRID